MAFSPSRHIPSRTPSPSSIPSSHEHRRLGWAALAYLANGPDRFLRAFASLPTAQGDPWIALHAIAQSQQRHRKHEDLARAIVRSLLRGGPDSPHDGPSPSSAAPLALLPREHLLALLDSACAFWMDRIARLQGMDDARMWEFLTAQGRFGWVCPSDGIWPSRQLEGLETLAGSAAPLCLWIEGDPRCLSRHPAIAIVGSRETSDYGLRCAREAGRRSARAGATVITGGALGIDAEANKGALLGGNAPTVAVFAGGLLHEGPAGNASLFSRIVEQGGALVSELPPDTIPYPSHFLERNRLIAALADTVLVAQARYRSGALNTANWGCQLHRTVLAVPGPIDSPLSAGCNRLLRSHQATILTDLKDVEGFIEPDLLTCGAGEDSADGGSRRQSPPSAPSRHPLSPRPGMVPAHREPEGGGPGGTQVEDRHVSESEVIAALRRGACDRPALEGRLRSSRSAVRREPPRVRDLTIRLGLMEAQGLILRDERGMIRLPLSGSGPHREGSAAPERRKDGR